MQMTSCKFATASLTVALLALGACARSGDSLLIVQGEIAGTTGRGYEMCDLNLHLASSQDVVGTKRVAPAFSAGFVVAPRDEDYFVSISCVGGRGKYVSHAFKFETKQHQQTVGLGSVVF